MNIKQGDEVRILSKPGIPSNTAGKKGYVVCVEKPDFPIYVRLETGQELSFAEDEVEKVKKG